MAHYQEKSWRREREDSGQMYKPYGIILSYYRISQLEPSLDRQSQASEILARTGIIKFNRINPWSTKEMN